MRILLKLSKRTQLPSQEGKYWSKEMLSLILTRLAECPTRSSAYAEAEMARGPVQFTVSSVRELTLTKRHEPIVVAEYGTNALNRFVGYLLRDVLQVERGGVGAGVFSVQFIDEPSERVYCLFARRSGALGDCFQIDEIPRHL